MAHADSELHKRTARQGAGYVEALRRKNVSADEGSHVCNRGTGGEELEKNEADCAAPVHI